VLLTWALLGAPTSRPTLVCLVVVVAGFFVGSEGEVNFSAVGTAFGVASSVFVALNSVMTKSAMELVDRNEWALCAYNNANAVLLFIPIIALSGEAHTLARSAALLSSAYYWSLMTLGGVFGFAIGIATIMQIKLTSPLTHNISGTAKSCVQTVLALFIWRNPTNATNLLGVALVLAGSLAYSAVRSGEMDAADAAKKAAAARAKEEALAAAESPAAAAGGAGDAAAPGATAPAGPLDALAAVAAKA
jgi:GDP-fucose transporter C1